MNDTLRTIHRLTTTRAGAFSDKAIRQEDLQTIIQASVCVANASARQSYSIIVVGDAPQGRARWPLLAAVERVGCHSTWRPSGTAADSEA